ncbi:zinc-ribbon domain-containing protein [Staphylococcus simiae]|uniref:Zinc-ribbon domain-containing protein n=1 Tax=Staphylococcus simiae CCM 7213 = CCUG 51256 TaxID=911238 RepID=G5JJR9_9STAP|nr:zinc ribbon domain-containing protein [Staphylococcus simiae]EHJ07576.1 hypothetical protein SS7213T_08642 [Staphylococcus simiae CCM 7213 = CCUG 51256]PNZ14680.1 zinc ribbon domain-containing protein [Staphylococcus simiae]SNV55162.1 Predicted membrane protein [Staphylococcus simiae]
MKYCPNCGHEIEGHQTFCNNCGHKLTASEQNQTQSNTNESRQSRPTPVQRPNPQRYQSPYYPPQKDGMSTFLKVILIIISLVVLALLLFGAYYAYKTFIANNNEPVTSQDQNNGSNHSHPTGSSSSHHTNTARGPEISIYSDSFDKEFMKSSSKDGYDGVYEGMTRAEVENKYGRPSGDVYVSGDRYDKYGDLGVLYRDGQVRDVVVAPTNVSENDYVDHYGEPDDRRHNLLIYDAYKHNDFSVVVNIDDDGMVTSIENIDQLPED